MNLRKRAAASPSILPSAAIQLSQPGPQASAGPLTRANEIGAKPSPMRGDALRRAAGVDTVAGLTAATGFACPADFCCSGGFCCETNFCWAAGLACAAGLIAGG